MVPRLGVFAFSKNFPIGLNLSVLISNMTILVFNVHVLKYGNKTFLVKNSKQSSTDAKLGLFVFSENLAIR